MVSKDLLDKQMEKVYNLLEGNVENLIELEFPKRDQVDIRGNLIEIRTDDPIYIIPNGLSFHVFSNLSNSENSLDEKLKNNENSLVILNNYPGENIFDSFVFSDTLDVVILFSNLSDLINYYEFLSKYPGRIITLGGESKIKAIDWFKNQIITKDNTLKELFNKFLSRKIFEEIKKDQKNLEERLDYYSELGRLAKAIEESKDAKNNLLKILLHYVTLPSSAHISFGNDNKILNIPGELPPLVLEKNPEKLNTKDYTILLVELIENTKPLSLQHLADMKNGSILDRRVSGKSNISVLDLYKLDKINKELISLPLRKEAFKTFLDEKLRLEKEIYKYLLFTPEILKNNNLDYIIAGSKSIRIPLSLNDPINNVLLYHKNGLYMIEIDPKILEKENSIKIYDLRRNKIKLLKLNNQNKTISSIIDEIEKKYEDAYESLAYLSENISSEELIKSGYRSLLILDEALKYLPKAILKSNRRKGNFSTYII